MKPQLFGVLTKLTCYTGRFMCDEDFANRLNHMFTSFLLVIFALIIFARQCMCKPIACWTPPEFTDAQKDYAESVCWVTNTYFTKDGVRSLSENTDEIDDKKLLYYQWIPFILIGQAFLFNIPSIIWQLLNRQLGINLVSVIQEACDIQIIKDRECRRVNLSYVAHHIHQSLKTRYINSKTYGSYLICLYIICKILYIINVITQFFIMNRFIGTIYTLYGFDLVKQLVEGRMWYESGHFPRITTCNFSIRKMGSIRLPRYTFQCVLPINMLNEKIFIFLWFWFMLVSAISIISLLSLTYKVGLAYNRINFIFTFLKLRYKSDDMSKNNCRNFIEQHLRPDGVFLIRLLAQNAGDLITSEITDELWRLYINNKADTKLDFPKLESQHSLAPDHLVISMKP